MDNNNIKTEKDIKQAVGAFEKMLREQLERNRKMRAANDVCNGYACSNAKENNNGSNDGTECLTAGKTISDKADTDVCECAGATWEKAVSQPCCAEKKRATVIGICNGDGIGNVIMPAARRVLEFMLKKEMQAGEIKFFEIKGFTLKKRLESGETVPCDVMEQLEKCDVLLKGPTATPSAGMEGKNLESANVYLRKAFDLFANVRPVSIPEQGIDWTFFRENTEGEYALGSSGVRIGDELSIDFKVTTNEGTRRIARAAYEFARANGKKKVSIITKANILKKTDGDFLKICREVGAEYPEIETDSRFIDIMAANLVNEDIRNEFQVFILPNLYGDILTDEAAQIQGGVGTASSANIGDNYALFEAIHGSAPRMVEEGLAHLANPAGLIKASVMMLTHIGCHDKAMQLEIALDKTCEEYESEMTGMPGALTCEEFTDAVISNL